METRKEEIQEISLEKNGESRRRGENERRKEKGQIQREKMNRRRKE
jgi:hypothetical protein